MPLPEIPEAPGGNPRVHQPFSVNRPSPLGGIVGWFGDDLEWLAGMNFLLAALHVADGGRLPNWVSTLTYSGGALQQIEVEHVTDGFLLQAIYTYSGGKVITEELKVFYGFGGTQRIYNALFTYAYNADGSVKSITASTPI